MRSVDESAQADATPSRQVCLSLLAVAGEAKAWSGGAKPADILACPRDRSSRPVVSSLERRLVSRTGIEPAPAEAPDT
jgi:hypothetical protein